MKTIKYFNYKNNENYYIQVRDTYNSEDKTIKVYDSQRFEFDFKTKFGMLHIRLFCNNIEDENSIVNWDSNIKYSNDEIPNSDGLFYNCDYVLSSYEINTFYKDNKEIIDKMLLTQGIDINSKLELREKQKGFEFIKTIMNSLYNQFFITYKKLSTLFETMKDKGVFNIKIYDTDSNGTNEVSFEQQSEQPTKTENKEVKEEEQTKVITMRYLEYKQTNFKSVNDSYDSVKQTIDVYVPLDYKPTEMKVVKVNYDDYKEKYRDKYEQVYNSYDSSDRTIEIRVPIDLEIESTKFHIVKMLFKDYKQKYSQYKTVTGTYSEIYGTIKVYLPEGVEYTKDDKDKNYEIKHAFKKGYIDDITITPKKLNIDDFDNTIPDELMI